MRIRRRGSLGLETMMAIPIAMVVILLGRFILEGSLNRQEIGLLTREGVVSTAEDMITNARDCTGDQSAFLDRESVTQSPSVTCDVRRAETGLRNEDPFWDAMEDAATAWQDILRDVRPSNPLYDVIGEGTSTVTLTAPNFLAQQGGKTSTQVHLRPQGDLWRDTQNQFAQGHDAVIWEELRRENTHLMFPNVFPSRVK